MRQVTKVRGAVSFSPKLDPFERTTGVASPPYPYATTSNPFVSSEFYELPCQFPVSSFQFPKGPPGIEPYNQITRSELQERSPVHQYRPRWSMARHRP